MSSFKKASKVNQKVHRERHQPADRTHLGILEKKKDYKYRANDYNAKQRAIKKLRKAALDRNPDEFYFHMINSETTDGLHKEKKKREPVEIVEQKKLMANKTLSYVTMKRTIESKKVDKMQKELHLVDVASHFDRQHVRFEENEESMDETTNRGVEIKDSPLSEFQLQKAIKLKTRRYKELARRIDRRNKLTAVQQKMEIARALKTDRSQIRPKLVKKETKMTAAVYRWKYERKR